MEIIFLGNGTLGIYLKNHLSKFYKVSILPLRNTTYEEFKEIISGFSTSKIIFDLMDPNKVDILTNKNLLTKANDFRYLISKSQLINHYIFLSTANLYKQSIKIIDEKSKTIINSTNYLNLKKNSEKLLNDFSIPLSICRIPNIWGHNSKKSFFFDLSNSYKNKSKIRYRENDDVVISYIHIKDLCILLEYLLKERIFGIINISTNSFNSRYNLKAKINNDYQKSISKLSGIRLLSNKLNWSDYLKKEELPF